MNSKAGVARSERQLGPTSVLGTTREWLDRWCERGILALVLAILVFGPLAIGAVGTLQFLIIEGLTLGVMLLWAVRLWLAPRPQLLWPPICWAVLAFTGYTLARYFTADIEYVARLEWLHVLVYAALFFAILNNLHRQESTQIICFTLIFLAMAIAFYAIYQFLTDSNHVWYFAAAYPHRGSGTYINPNHLGGFLEMLLPLALAYTLAGRLKHLTRVFLGYAALVLLAGIAVTLSRGSWFSTGLALLLFLGVLLWQRQHRLPALLLLVVLVGAGVFFLPRSYFFKVRLRQLVTPQGQVDDDSRFDLWRPALRMWGDHPWWGVGPAHFDYRFRAYRPANVQVRPQWAHNDYLNTLADYGLAGTALVAGAWLLLGLGVTRTWRSFRNTSAHLGPTKGSNRFAFVLGAACGLAAILFHSALDFNLHIPANAILAVTLMALLTSHLRFATERYWVGVRLWAKVFASLLLLAGAAYLAQQARRQGAEYAWLQRAGRVPVFSQAQIDLLTRAFAAEPMNPETAYAIGEALRRQSQEGSGFYPDQGGADYRHLARLAMEWFQRGMKLNPCDSRNYAGCGWCLDWLGRSAESAPCFSRAEELDPNGYFTVNDIGMHYLQCGQYAAARSWFERSLQLQSLDNPIARSYLQIISDRLLDAATNELSARLASPSR